MATISGYDSSSISTLFSSIGQGNSSNNNNMLGINLTDYATIRSGTYFRLLKSYYAKDASDSRTDKTSKTNSAKSTTATSKDDQKTLANVESTSKALTESAKDLYKTGSSLFQKVTTKDEEGNTTTGYDVNKIYEAVKGFVDDYNSMLKTAGNSNADSISRSVSSLIYTTKSNSDLLGSLGITINKDDNSLSIDADKFKSADMVNAKSLFNGNGSYAYSVASRAALIHSYAEAEAAKANTYTGSGKYGDTFSSGSIYDSFL